MRSACCCYWSGGTIQLGRDAVKYALKPTHADRASYVPFGPAEYLRDEFRARLKATDITFDFYVQFFVDEKTTPIEDDTVEWDSPFVKVAELTIKKRDLDTPEGAKEHVFGESLACTPWHGRADMRPLGHMNRCRLAIYAASARLTLGHPSVEPPVRKPSSDRTALAAGPPRARPV